MAIELSRDEVIEHANHIAHRLGYDNWEHFEREHPDGVWEGSHEEIMLAMLIGMPWGD